MELWRVPLRELVAFVGENRGSLSNHAEIPSLLMGKRFSIWYDCRPPSCVPTPAARRSKEARCVPVLSAATTRSAGNIAIADARLSPPGLDHQAHRSMLRRGVRRAGRISCDLHPRSDLGYS